MNIPSSKFKRGSRAAILEKIVETQKEVITAKRELADEAGRLVDKALVERLTTVESLMRRVVALQEVLIDKGMVTREEVDAKRNELKPFWNEK